MYAQMEVWLPVLLVVSWTGKMGYSLSPFVPDNLVSQERFGHPSHISPVILHTQAESGAYCTHGFLSFLPASRDIDFRL